MAILIIDDSKDTQLLLKSHLQSHLGHAIITAQSADEGIAKITADTQLIILDILMPGKDGITTCKEIKNNPETSDIPIIFITCCADTEILEAAFNAGAADYIIKPVNKIELRARVRTQLNLKKEMESRIAREQELHSLNEELKEINELLRKLSMVDGLTGIANRRYFDEVLSKEWARAIRNKTPLSAIFFDIDYFKKYNDKYGHQAGDDTLIKIAQTVADKLKRAGDLVARYGGEEFIIILPETNLEGAYDVAEYLRKSVEELNIKHEASEIANVVTISLGVTEMLGEGDEANEMIKRADNAVYRAKNNGRNRTEIFQECLQVR